MRIVNYFPHRNQKLVYENFITVWTCLKYLFFLTHHIFIIYKGIRKIRRDDNDDDTICREFK